MCVCIFIHSSVTFDPKVENQKFPSIPVFRCPFQFSIRFPSRPFQHILNPCISWSPLIHSACYSRICRCNKPVDHHTCLHISFSASSYLSRNVILYAFCLAFLICYPVSEIYLKHLSAAPHIQSVYFLSHLLVPCPTLTPVTSYREHIAVENLQYCAQTDVPSRYFFVFSRMQL